MDPNAALDTILGHIDYFFSQESPDEGTPKRETNQQEFERIQEVFTTFMFLHDWLRKGGYPPAKWNQRDGALAVFLNGNLSDGFKAVGPMPLDDAIMNTTDREGWIMELVND